MANPLFGLLGGDQQASNMQQQFNQFKQTVSGDPKAIVQQLMNSGQMSPQQFQQLSMMAKGLQGVLH